jgi:hypothetical protein
MNRSGEMTGMNTQKKKKQVLRASIQGRGEMLPDVFSTELYKYPQRGKSNCVIIKVTRCITDSGNNISGRIPEVLNMAPTVANVCMIL